MRARYEIFSGGISIGSRERSERITRAIKFGKIYADYWVILAKWPTKGRGDVSFPKVRPIKSARKKWDAERGDALDEEETPKCRVHTYTNNDVPIPQGARFFARPFSHLLLLFGPSSFPSCPYSFSSSRSFARRVRGRVSLSSRL